MSSAMKIAVVGTGYVGLVSGVCLAAKGHDVVCLDLRKEIVDTLNRAEPHIHEEGLPELLREVVAAGRFRARLAAEEELLDRELVLLAVGTPSTDGKIDLTAIREASRFVGRAIAKAGRSISVVVKSTVVPGTTDTAVRAELEAASGLSLGSGPGTFGLGMNPEFLREGNAIEDFMKPDRIVFGHEDPETLRRLEALYAPWECDKVAVNTRTAEFIKYANNALLAVQISAINELANLSARVTGVEIADVLRGVHLDKRWNPILAAESNPGTRAKPGILTYLVPGCGFGGSCFPKDVQALRTQGREHGLPMEMLEAVLSVNDRQPLEAVRLLEEALGVPIGGSLEGKTVLLLGLAFKPGTDDIRESASLRMLDALLAAGASVLAHDPIASPGVAKVRNHARLRFVDGWETALADAGTDAVLLATAWPEYRRLAAPELAATRAGKAVIDARGLLKPADVLPASYATIGRQPLKKNA